MTFSLINDLNETIDELLALVEAAELDFLNSSHLFEDIEWKDDPENRKFIGQGKTGETGAGLKARREREQTPASGDIIRFRDPEGNEAIGVIRSVSSGKVSYAFKQKGKLQVGSADIAKLQYRANTENDRKVFTIQSKAITV